MKLEIKILFVFIGFILLVHPAILDAKVLKSGDAGYKDPLIALVLSIVLPGLGHFYLGDTSKALIFCAIAVGIWVVSIFFWFFFLAYFALVAWAAYDAYTAAKKQNEGGGKKKIALIDHAIPEAVAVY